MKNYNRQFEVERASVNVEAGTFEAVLFTDGEASDGHILDIGGGKIPARMPLFVNHNADPTTQLGSLHLAGKEDHKVRVRGEVFTEGEGAPLEVRKDLLAKMAAGHVSRMSGRWDANDKDAVRRINLPSDHPAFVDDTKETESRKRWGYFFKKWQAQEGSVVGLGADPQAVMRWANDGESPECVREFWRGQVPEAQDTGLRAVLTNAARAALDAGINPAEVADCVNAVLPITALPDGHGADTDVEDAIDAADVDATSGDVVVGLDELDDATIGLDLGLEHMDSAAEADAEYIDAALEPILKRLDAIDARLAEKVTPQPVAIEEPGRVEEQDAPPPSAPEEVMTPQQVFAEIREGLRAARAEVMDELRDRLAAARGKVE